MTYIINGAKEMGLSPLCEGVETAEQYEFLKTTGCERAQGFYFGKAMPMNETREFTRAKGMIWEKS
jgi:EAL domain-containing protein (putative c-di-GMP-specific phosphodiesterase class I)